MTRAASEAWHQPVTQVAVGLRIGATAEGHPVPDRPVGTLTLEGTRPVFVYDPAFLADPLPLSPLQLPAHAGAYRHADPDFEHLPGLLADALPDGWGRLLHDRAYARAGRALDTVTALDRLAAVGHAAMGALVFDPAIPLGVDAAHEAEAELDLDAVAAQAQRLAAGSDEAVLPALQLGGGAPGGARPKALIGLRREADRVHGIAGVTPAMVRGEAHALPDDYAPWLVKFTSHEDHARFGPDVGTVEACYAVMARRAGLTMAETTLLTDAAGRRHFATARFDRAGPGGRQRVHVHTAGGLLHASFRLPSLDYAALFQLTGALTRSPAQLRELFRRMVFNVYAYNRDDHAKNFAFRMTADGTWTLAPAYDLMFSPGMHGRHATAIDGVDDWPTRAGLLQLGERHRLARQDLEQDLAQVREAVAAGPALAREWGCARSTCAMLQTHFEEIARRAG